MAKREIKRQVEAEAEIPARGEAVDEMGQVTEKQKDIPIEVIREAIAQSSRGNIVPVKPVNVSVTFDKLPSYMAVRILSKFVLFNDGHKMRRENIVPGKPVTITIKQ